MKRLTLLVAALVLVFVLPAEAQDQDQTSVQIGPRVGMDIGDIEDPYFGIDARITSTQFPLVINPTFDYYFVGDRLTFWSLSGNLLYLIGMEDHAFDLYGGAGLGIYRSTAEGEVTERPFRNSSTDVGANFVGGILVPSAPFTPFAEVQWTTLFAENSPTLFGLKGGILIGF